MSGILNAVGQSAYKLAFEISPIVLVGGLASAIPFVGMLPIVALTEGPIGLAISLLSGNLSLDNFLAHWQPLPGSTLFEQQIGPYPFANQSVAANAVIAQPLNISMLMVCPARGEAGYPLKLLTMTLLKAALTRHAALGGTYIVATPCGFIPDCILLTIRDVSNQASHQPQNAWQFDFEKPLITVNDAAGALAALLAKIDGGGQIAGSPAWSGITAPTSVVGGIPVPG